MSTETTTAPASDAKPDAKAKVTELVNEAVNAALPDALAKALAPFQESLAKTVTESLAKANPTQPLSPEDQKGHDLLAAAANASAQTDPNVRVKQASEWYSDTKSACTWLKGREEGKPAYLWENGAPRYIDNPSQLQLAKAGAWLKMQIREQIPELRGRIKLTEHDKQLIRETVSRDRFVGPIGQKDHFIGSRKLSEADQMELNLKAVLDESGASRGDQAVPEFFDDAIIRTPLLHGELFPHIEVIPVQRGSSADGFTISTPTFVSTASGSTITPFSTTSFVTAFDTTFYPASCGFEMGLDFESDAVPAFAQSVIDQIGEEAKRWLDEQIAVGDGTTEPQGIFTASGTSVSPDSSHTFSSFTYADIVTLAFGINKAHRNAFGGNATRFVMNDSQYKELMQIATGVTGDTRPVFGMMWKEYMLGDYPVSVQNDVSDGNLALCNLRGYRMYRRQGLQFVQDETGRTSRLANTRLLLGRMRWGGKITLASGYIAEMTT